MTTLVYRTIWISDLHIGSTQCQADTLLDFLKHNNSDKLYLVGDIIDFWALSKKMYWPASHNTIIQKILRKARQGTQIIYIPGNHDENVRDYDNYIFGDIIVKKSDIHTTQHHKWIAKIGSVGYDWLIEINRVLRIFRQWFGIRSNFSLAAYVKFKVKNVVQFISDYEISIVHSLKHANVDGVICGHIHHAEIKNIEDFLYVNTGDFVESCTAIVEHQDGSLELIKWQNSEIPLLEAPLPAV